MTPREVRWFSQIERLADAGPARSVRSLQSTHRRPHFRVDAVVAEDDRLLTAGAGDRIVRSRGEGHSLLAVFDSAPPAICAALDSQLE